MGDTSEHVTGTGPAAVLATSVDSASFIAEWVREVPHLSAARRDRDYAKSHRSPGSSCVVSGTRFEWGSLALAHTGVRKEAWLCFYYYLFSFSPHLAISADCRVE